MKAKRVMAKNKRVFILFPNGFDAGVGLLSLGTNK